MSLRARPWAPGTPCWLDLATPDAEGARDFYAALHGWSYDVAGPELGSYAVARRGGAATAGIMPRPDEPAAWTLYFASDDVAATATAVTAAGGRVLLGPLPVPGSGAMLVATDPAGARFGAWQAGPFIGAELVNETGALLWEDLRSADPEASRAFLTRVFGLRHETPQGVPDGYTTLELDEPYPVGGAGPLFGAPSTTWVVYFGVDDVDAAAALAVERGGTVVTAPSDSPFGRLATLRDPHGAAFAVLRPSLPTPDRT